MRIWRWPTLRRKKGLKSATNWTGGMEKPTSEDWLRPMKKKRQTWSGLRSRRQCVRAASAMWKRQEGAITYASADKYLPNAPDNFADDMLEVHAALLLPLWTKVEP